MEEKLAANTVEYAVDTAWYVSVVEKVVRKNIRMRGRYVPDDGHLMAETCCPF